jgi:hypothetical protein
LVHLQTHISLCKKHHTSSCPNLQLLFRTIGFNVETSFNWVVSSTGLLQASATATTPQTSNFLACKEGSLWVLYLPGGADLPAEQCVLTQLQVGGLVTTSPISSIPSTTTTTTTKTTTHLPITTTTTASRVVVTDPGQVHYGQCGGLSHD